MTTHTRIRPFAAKMLWLIGLTAFLVMTIPWQQGLAQPGKRLADLGPAHFSPATRPPLADIPANGIGHNFQLMDHNPLVNPGETLPRGGNGNDIPIVRDCLYAASRRGPQGTLIVDISNPRKTKVVGEIPAPTPPPSGANLQHADMAAIESEDLLVRQVWNNSSPFDGNRIEIYDTSGGCSNPVLVSTIPLGITVPHEHFIWQGGSPKRVLLYVVFLGLGNTRLQVEFPAPPRDIDLRVFDITDKFNPVGPVATWSLQLFGIPTFENPDLLKNGNQGQNNTMHSVSVSADGTRVYVSQMHAGFFILDSTPLGTGAPCDVDSDVAPSPGNPFGVNPDACLKKLHPDPNERLDYHPPWGQMWTHTAVKVPNRPYVIINDEPAQCPWSWVHIVNVDDTFEFKFDQGTTTGPVAAGTKFNGDLFPATFGAFTIPENSVEKCAENEAKFRVGGVGGLSFNSHKSLVFENLFFVSWLSGGVRAVDISNAGTPHETGFFFNKPVQEFETGPALREMEIRSYPVLKDGLLYFLDGASGVYVLKYTGDRKEEIPQEGLFTTNAIQVPGQQP